MSDIAQLVKALHEIDQTLEVIGIILLCMLLLKNMGGKER